MPTFIREYQLLAELARGGMGSVFLARRRDEGRAGGCLAIKVMDAELHSEPEARFMLLDEAHTAMRVRHSNVTSVVDVGSCDSRCYLVMEYVEGCSLQQLLLANPSFRPPHLILPIMIDVLTGLYAAHTLRDPNGDSYEIVHRDVTPHNVLVGIDGSSKITDFGIAKAKERYTATEVGFRKGKASFMAPEQFRGDAVDHKADLWAAGVTLFSALTGVLPFGEGLSVATLEKVLHGEVPLPSRVGLGAPPCLDWVLQTALQRNPAARFHDARAFADALRCVAARHNLLGTPGEVSAWVRKSWGTRLSELRLKVAQGHEIGLERPSLPPLPMRPTLPARRPLPNDVTPRVHDELTTVRQAPRPVARSLEALRRTFTGAGRGRS